MELLESSECRSKVVCIKTTLYILIETSAITLPILLRRVLGFCERHESPASLAARIPFTFSSIFFEVTPLLDIEYSPMHSL